MADKTTESKSVVLIFTLQDSQGLQTSRMITFDTNLTSDARANLSAFKNDYLANYKYAIQPTGWRDSDYADEAYECVGLDVKIVSKTETELDI